MTEGRETRAGGEQGEWRWEVYKPEELPGALLDLPGDVRAEMESDITLVWKCVRGEWLKWVVVMESAVLRRLDIKELGLYAWGKHPKGGVIGEYTGVVLARFREGCVLLGGVGGC